MKYGLVGKDLKYSYSKEIHALFGNSDYELTEIDQSRFKDFILSKNYNGLNITMPYKKEVIKYLDKVDDVSKGIGAVNTVVNDGGRLIGYNTDILGLDYALKCAKINLRNKNLLILGSGGTSLTVKAYAEKERAKSVKTVSRTGEINYDNCYALTKTQVIINATPIGTDKIGLYGKLIDLRKFKNLEGVFDAVYNPFITELIYDAKLLNLKCSGGLNMLIYQAYVAEKLFGLTPKISVEKAITKIKLTYGNVYLTGLSGAGKTEIGKNIATKLGKDFIDTDRIIESEEREKIKDVFSKNGEDYFRKAEENAVRKVCDLKGKVIALGGGAIINANNVYPIIKNGTVIYIKRKLNKIDTSNRPIYQDKSVRKVYRKRKKTYLKYAEYKVMNKGVDKTSKEIIKLL